MQKILDVRVLKKFGYYFGLMTVSAVVASASMYVGITTSEYYFGSPLPFIFTLFGIGFFGGIFMMAREQVSMERIREQHQLDYIAAKLEADEKHQEWRENFNKRFGQYP